MDNIYDIEGIDSSPFNFTVAIVGMLVGTILLFYSIYTVDTSYKRHNQEIFQTGLSYALTAYSTTYSDTISNLTNISEGWLNDEDINIYKQQTNPVNIDYNKASSYLFNVLESNVALNANQIKTNGLYVINITTVFKPSEQYIVSIMRNGNDAIAYNVTFNTVQQIQSFVESQLGVTIDIAVNFNASIRDAQKYAAETSTNSTGNVYSSYTTNMCIVKDVPIKGLFGKELVNVHEIQTYSVVRKGD